MPIVWPGTSVILAAMVVRAEAAVELLSIGEPRPEKVGRHQLGMGREGQGVPSDQAAFDGLLQTGRGSLAGVLEMVCRSATRPSSR